MHRHDAETAVWFTSDLFDAAEETRFSTDIRSYPQDVEKSVENCTFRCGKTAGKPTEQCEENRASRKNFRLCHGFSTRHGGVSTLPHISDLNFGFSVGEDRETTLENYRRFASLLGIRAEHLLCAKQTHTSRVLIADRRFCGLGLWESVRTQKPEAAVQEEGYDALVTADSDTALVIRTADCVPILFYEPLHGIIGAAHAGWRGTCGGIAAKTVRAMTALGAVPGEIRCCIGNAVGLCCYEVDDRFYETFRSTFGEAFCREIFRKSPDYEHPDRFHCDLRACNRLLLREAGIQEQHIEVSPHCTCCEPELFHSHRYAMKHTNGIRGLMAAMISMESSAAES